MRLSIMLPLIGAAATFAASAGAQTAEPPPASPPPPTPPATTAPAAPAAAPTSSAIQLTTLRDMRDRGVISQEEYDSAIRDIGGSTGEQAAGEGPSLALGRWSTTFYGFIEADAIYDTTQGLNDGAGNAQIPRPNGAAPPLPASQQTYAGSNGQTQFSVRNSRFGVRLKPPGSDSIRTSAMLEMDFLGSQQIGSGTGQVSENAFFTSPLFRLRHAMFRVETPVVDFLVGQYWHLFGWQGVYHPNTVEIQGVPGELYARTPQFRISKTIPTGPMTLEVAVAAMRPPARTSSIPEFTGGVRLAVNEWTGMQTNGATATAVNPASIALTADYRRFQVPAADTVVPTSTVATDAKSIAADAFLPVLPATKDHRDNALSLTGEIVYGAAIQDLYTALNTGVQFPYVPDNTGAANVQTWPQNLDPGMVNYDINVGGFALHPIQWTSYILGLQYYLPALKGKVWVSANYSHTQSRDASFLGSNYSATSDFARTGATNPKAYYFQTSTAQVRAGEDWWDVNVFVDPLPSVRLGLELAEFLDHYVDGLTATSFRGQFSGFFLF
jgi:hypothetical protein